MTNGIVMFIIDLFRKARPRFASYAFASVRLKYAKNTLVLQAKGLPFRI